MVVTASRTHAERIDQLVRQETHKQPQLAEFFDAHGERESFECVSMSELTHRLGGSSDLLGRVWPDARGQNLRNPGGLSISRMSVAGMGEPDCLGQKTHDGRFLLQL